MLPEEILSSRPAGAKRRDGQAGGLGDYHIQRVAGRLERRKDKLRIRSILIAVSFN
jgi:hypothetical protein